MLYVDNGLAARLDHLAGELSSALIALPADTIDGAIDATLRRIVETIGADRSSLAEFNDEVSAVEAVYSWARPDIPPVQRGDVSLMPAVLDMVMRGQPMVFNRLPDDLPAEARTDEPFLTRHPTKSAILLPVAVAGRRVCALGLGTVHEYVTWPTGIVDRLQFIAEILAAALHRRRQERALTRSRAEVARLQAELQSENIYLQEEIKSLHGFDDIIGDSAAMRSALARVQEVAATDATVLLFGETGTGKELFARALHERSDRRQRPLVRVNCAALPASLIETELFGHERGAFTGAVTMRQGRFELADRGTIFLDEIGDLPTELQAKLLRVLQEGEFERLGSSHTRKVDVRVVAATHRDLDAAVEEGGFRADLYYRLSVFPIRLPPVRERREDIPRLVWFFIHQRQRSLHRQIKKVPDAVMAALKAYSWPGNVRELENVTERAMIRSTGDTLFLDEGLGAMPRRETGVQNTLEVVERRHIEGVLERCGWRINGPHNAAEQLAIHPNTLRFRMKKLGIVRPMRPNGGSGGNNGSRGLR